MVSWRQYDRIYNTNVAQFSPNLPKSDVLQIAKKYQSTLAIFVGQFIDMKFKKSPNLVTLVGDHVMKQLLPIGKTLTVCFNK